MELKDYTTDELRMELRRRKDEELKKRSLNGENVPKYLYAKGVVKDILNTNRAFCNWVWYVDIFDEDWKRLGLSVSNTSHWYQLCSGGIFRKNNSPKIGDVVMLKCRVTKAMPDFSFIHARICEIINKK